MSIKYINKFKGYPTQLIKPLIEQADTKEVLQKAVKEFLYDTNAPRIEGIVERIDECWRQDNKEGMLYYAKYIQAYSEFMEGIKNE